MTLLFSKTLGWWFRDNESTSYAGELGSILDQEDSLEKEIATYSSILAWEIPWTKEPGRLQSMELQSWT